MWTNFHNFCTARKRMKIISADSAHSPLRFRSATSRYIIFCHARSIHAPLRYTRFSAGSAPLRFAHASLTVDCHGAGLQVVAYRKRIVDLAGTRYTTCCCFRTAPTAFTWTCRRTASRSRSPLWNTTAGD